MHGRGPGEASDQRRAPDAVLYELLELLEPEAPLPRDEALKDLATDAARHARSQGSAAYSTAITFALSDLAVRLIEDNLASAGGFVYVAALQSGAPEPVRVRVARKLSACGWLGQQVAVSSLSLLDKQSALSIASSIFRAPATPYIQGQAAHQMAQAAVRDSVESGTDCCELLDTVESSPEPYVVAVHFLLAARLGQVDEVGNDRIDQLFFSGSFDLVDERSEDLSEQILELFEEIRNEEVDCAIVQARRGWGIAEVDDDWVKEAFRRVVQRQRSTDFARLATLLGEQEQYWQELDDWLAEYMDPDGIVGWVAGGTAESLIGRAYEPTSIRRVAADVIGLLGERRTFIADTLDFPKALADLCTPELDGALLADDAFATSVARALGLYGSAETYQADVLASLTQLSTHPSAQVREVAALSIARIQGVDRIDGVVGSSPARTAIKPEEMPARGWLASLELYRWQREALEAWVAAGRRGVVEAVTGAGKTRLALAVVAEALARGRKVAVLVPGLELLRQWHREIDGKLLQEAGLSFRVGRLGGGHSGSLASCDVLLATMQSASRYQLDPPTDGAVVIVDEAHRAGASSWSLALEQGFDERLGLTATYEREDLGVEEFLDPYFGGVCASVGYGEALRDGVIAPFKVAYVGVRFAPEERLEYDKAAERASRYRAKLIAEWKCPAEPFGAFMQAVHHLQASGVAEGSRLAGFYLSAFAKRRAVLSNARGKLHRLRELAGAVERAEKTIVFTQTKQAAIEAVAVLAHDGIEGAVLHSDMDLDARARVFAGFEDGDHELVAAPRLLDEGIDVPAADLGVVLAASRSRRQMIQRMGRVLRRKEDGRAARFVIMFVEGSTEDPSQPGHEGFTELITPHAQWVRRFDDAANSEAINTFLHPDTTEAAATTNLDLHALEDQAPAARAANQITLETDSLGDLLAMGLDADGALDQTRAWYTAAREGDTQAQVHLGLILIQQDPPVADEARAWFTAAAEAGDRDAQYNLGVLAAKSTPPDIDEARRWYTLAADAGHPWAQDALGTIAENSAPPDIDEARRWYTLAAEAGETVAQANLGRLLLDKVKPQEVDEARRWLTKAARAGNLIAQFDLGSLLSDRLDPPDLEEARVWYTAAAQADDTATQFELGFPVPDHVVAQFNLGVLLADRLGPPEINEARHWYSLAAKAGFDLAQLNLGALLADRLDPPELEEARSWYTLAAKAGHEPSQVNLGLLLADRLDPPEIDEARHWLTIAAEAGNSSARLNLGFLLCRLDPPELVEARRWLTASAEAGNTYAKLQLAIIRDR